MDDYISATLLPLEEKLNLLDSSDRRLLDEMANHLLMTHELLQNHRNCEREINQAPGYWADPPEDPDYLGNHH